MFTCQMGSVTAYETISSHVISATTSYLIRGLSERNLASWLVTEEQKGDTVFF